MTQAIFLVCFLFFLPSSEPERGCRMFFIHPISIGWFDSFFVSFFSFICIITFFLFFLFFFYLFLFFFFFSLIKLQVLLKIWIPTF
jgi:hypothetical protein